jgi:hypothetical protein
MTMNHRLLWLLAAAPSDHYGDSGARIRHDPALSLQNPSTFGVIGIQLNSPRFVRIRAAFGFLEPERIITIGIE